jgi:hypothetical protein
MSHCKPSTYILSHVSCFLLAEISSLNSALNLRSSTLSKDAITSSMLHLDSSDFSEPVVVSIRTVVQNDSAMDDRVENNFANHSDLQGRFTNFTKFLTKESR